MLFGEESALVGIVTDPPSSLETAAGLPGVILLNAGLVHRVGPNRLYVEIARSLAALGMTVLRFDLSGLGDSPARRDHLPFDKSVLLETRQAMSFLSAARGVETFVLAGLCSGAAGAFATACADSRVAGAVLINVQGEAPADLAPVLAGAGGARYYWRSALLDPRSWRRAFQGRSDYRGLLRALGFPLRKLFAGRRPASREAAGLRRDLRLLTGRGTRLLLVFSDGDPGLDYVRLILGRELGKLSAGGRLRLEVIPRTNHTFDSLQGQDRLLRLLQDWLRPGTRG